MRGFTQDDAHIFCTPEQIEDEVSGCIDFALAVLKTYGFDQYQVELSTWDPNDRKTFIGSDEQWQSSEASLKNVLERRGIPYKLIPGEAAFYGPKIDIKLVDAIGRLWQLCTVQFDWNLPQRFELEYVGEDGKRHQPLMVHRALYGSIERFFGVLIEHYAGAFPVWLSPVQVVVIPIGEKHHAYANEVGEKLKAAGVRVHVDTAQRKDERQNPRARHAEGAVPTRRRRQGDGGRRGQRARPRPGKGRRVGEGGGVCRAGEGADREQEPYAVDIAALDTGSANITLDTSFSINSLTLGGSTGSSILTGDGNAHTLTIRQGR